MTTVLQAAPREFTEPSGINLGAEFSDLNPYITQLNSLLTNCATRI